ncbi:DUF3040 domain-containing protein [Corynebacterium sanguinis]|uniref:DUF3040 domain-containing protein n=1 Tax=Corynebacterium sanguinis TaxID=2594913 RepID=A0A6C1TZH7_9CORY|nr:MULTISPECIES: DUF3040 domain-containing protein [Corynebacterium]MBA4504614.1 DUF3040 domain-containing protein [Corynebacterium sanguinis]MCT1411889.1 DUF3040 domain-containing protein [Corynebacterium sanguinis]MCT1413222.1 DUF3040 domain-containing protein [Corynebacterium sanguinis]MCT1424881.1 DUF3040 domain-containing protein [Corynebacterium sanguinis]MCT1443786.1 DUF3040 domain-containing protein [Corynebacterium sanguinis]
MSLSEQEQRTLREIEQSLLAEDPKFGNRVPQGSGFAGQPGGGRLTMRSAALMVTGLVLLIGGVALATVSVWLVAISVVGFAIMLAGGVMALTSPSGGSSVPVRAVAAQRPARTSKMEENFKRRFEGQ